MGKFTDVETDVFSVFASAAWITESISTYPANHIIENDGNEFIRVSIIPGGEGVNLHSVSGQLIVDIFTSAGEGPSRISAIADIVDSYLSGKTFKASGKTSQFHSGALGNAQVDEDNPSLYKAIYSISFNYFGVL